MKNYWILGHPLRFCLTEPVMNGSFKEQDLDAQFETHNVEPEDLDNVLSKVKEGELAGAMITRPFKTPSLDHLDEASEEVELLYAVNLILNEGGKLKGYNTDWLGARDSIKTKLPSLNGLHVHILGAGGAARAAAYACKQEGARVSIWNRTAERAKKAADKLDLEWVEDMRVWTEKPDVIINATSSSDQPSQSTLIPFQLWANVQLAMDAVYGKTSLFLEEAKAAQVEHILTGETWFIKQFLPMYKLITGKEAPLELVEKLVDEAQAIQKRD